MSPAIPAPQPADGEAMRERMIARAETISAAVDELRAWEKGSEKHFAERGAELEQAARSGELGRDWQKLQGRIDLGETTWEAAVSGDDESSEAAELRRASGSGLTALRERAEQEAEENDEPDPFAELTLLQAKLEARSAQLRRLVEDGGAR